MKGEWGPLEWELSPPLSLSCHFFCFCICSKVLLNLNLKSTLNTLKNLFVRIRNLGIPSCAKCMEIFTKLIQGIDELIYLPFDDFIRDECCLSVSIKQNDSF